MSHVAGMTLEFLSREMRQFADLAAESSVPILLHGETGSGKNHLADVIHQLGDRSGHPLVKINCPSIPEGLFEREMFGHVRGAFTDAKTSSKGVFEEAGGGTLFLDEIGELSLGAQAKLLRALDDSMIRPVGASRAVRFHARVITASNRDLWQMAAAGQFRQDLLYRCAVLEFFVPPLRERRDTIPGLARHFIQRYAPSERPPPAITPAAIDMLRSADWPGNIRQIANCIRRTILISRGRAIEAKHLEMAGLEPASRYTVDGRPAPGRTCEEKPSSDAPMGDAPQRRQGGSFSRYKAPAEPREERQSIRNALKAERGNKTRAARRLGMARSTLWTKLKVYDLAGPEQP